MSGGGREALPYVWEWSEDPLVCPGVVGRRSLMSESGRESLPDVQKLSGGPHESL